MTNQEQYELICEKAKKYDRLVDVLDKIRTEIIQMPTISFNANDIYKADVLAIIDKYKTESEGKE